MTLFYTDLDRRKIEVRRIDKMGRNAVDSNALFIDDLFVPGFAGRIAIHPDQVGTINEAFTPSSAEIEAARRVVASFAAEPGAGVVQLDGRMLDIPHLRQAEHTLEQGGAL
jgi:citrate lyase beta subunit